jgi:hypothetical protein
VSFPAAEDDADPFEGQDEDGAVVGFALLSLGLIEVFRPFEERHRLGGELVNGLVGGLWTEESTMYPDRIFHYVLPPEQFRWSF